MHGLSKKKAIVAVARKMAELMYTLLKNNSKYEPRKFVTPLGRTERLAQLAVAG